MTNPHLNKRTKYYLENSYHGIAFDTERAMSNEEACYFMSKVLKDGYKLVRSVSVNGYNRIAVSYLFNYSGKYGNGYVIIRHSYTQHDYSIMDILVR